EDLGPLLGGKGGADRPAFAEGDYTAFVLGWSPTRALRLGRRKLIEAPRPEAYDLAKDPRELANLLEPSTPIAAAGEDVRALAREMRRVVERRPPAPATPPALHPGGARRPAPPRPHSGGAAAGRRRAAPAARGAPK